MFSFGEFPLYYCHYVMMPKSRDIYSEIKQENKMLKPERSVCLKVLSIS